MKKLLLFLAFLSVTTTSNAQWTKTNGPEGGIVMALIVDGTNLFAGTFGGGAFLSTDGGNSWAEMNNGLTNKYINSFAVSGTNLFAGTNGGVFLSNDNGSSWTEVNNGLTNTNINSFAVSGTNLFAGTEWGGVFLSTNNGSSWTTVNSVLNGTWVVSFAVSGTNLFAGTNWGVYLSTNNGNSWTAVNNGLTHTDVLSLAAIGTNLYAGTVGGGVFINTAILTGINEETNDNFQVNVYPNPISKGGNVFTITSDELLKNTHVEVYDILGKIIYSDYVVNTTSKEIYVKNISSGIYFVKLSTGEKLYTQKLIVQ